VPTFADALSLDAAVRQAVAAVRVVDIHTHLFPPSHGERLLLWGVDELLTYHYLVSELFTVAPATLQPEAFYAMPKRQQADLVWEHVFLRHGGLSEAARGVMTSLNRLGLDVAGRKLDEARLWFDGQKADEYLLRVFELSGVEYAVMTNDPFEAEEVPPLLAGLPCPQCLRPALRIEMPILKWPAAAAAMRKQEYKTTASPSPAAFAQARKFLADWIHRVHPLYLAASLPPNFVYPSRESAGKPSTAVLDKVILPTAKEFGLPLALMIGVRRRVNPPLGWAGDAMGDADVSSVQRLCQMHPGAKFMATLLSRGNQQELCAIAQKFRNLHIFGCWWFCNTPSVIAEMTRLRLELLGTTFTCQHSDARVLDHLLYKWPHSREVVADVLAEKYRLQFAAGWRATEAEIRRDVRGLFGGSFEEFLKR
jgi:hypothetical protein